MKHDERQQASRPSLTPGVVRRDTAVMIDPVEPPRCLHAGKLLQAAIPCVYDFDFDLDLDLGLLSSQVFKYRAQHQTMARIL